MNKKDRRKPAGKAAQAQPDWKVLDIVHPNAAGIDIGGREHWVAISPDRDQEPVRSFGCCTEDLQQMAEWLNSHGVTSVAMQSTGVYWIPVLEMLEQRGLEVYLVNARHTKNLPGRKRDDLESQWLLKLHTFGLLNSSFQPTDPVRALRSYWRKRAVLVALASSAIQRMQKALTEMNVQLSTVLSDISGVSGMAIIQAILKGEREPGVLAKLADPQVKASKKAIARSLEGNWRKEILVDLEIEVELYRTYQENIGLIDRHLQQHLRDMEPKQADSEREPLGPRPKGKRARGNAPKFDLRSELYRLSGVDWAQIDGVDVQVAQTVISEVGVDLSAFPTEGHFTSWLGLAPGNESSGGKILNRRTKKVVNRATVALRQAASALIKSDSFLGAQYRRLRTRLGAPKAITAMARKLACIFYRLLTQGSQYVDKGAEHYQAKFREQQLRYVKKQAKLLGMELVEAKP